MIERIPKGHESSEIWRLVEFASEKPKLSPDTIRRLKKAGLIGMVPLGALAAYGGVKYGLGGALKGGDMKQ